MAAIAMRLTSERNAILLSADIAFFPLYCVFVIHSATSVFLNLNITRRNVEKELAQNLKLDRGTGCVLPSVDPFSREAIKFDEKLPKVKCAGQIDWVRCYYSQCSVVEEIKDIVKGIECDFKDILYHNDAKYTIGPALFLHQEEIYELSKSDHIKVQCNGTSPDGNISWSGNTIGFRRVEPQKSPPGRENAYNVLIFGFDSMSRNGFIRLMPKSWKVLTEELEATVMKGYNIVGEATPAAIIPILTGHTELELPEARTRVPDSSTVDGFPFIFYKVKKDGYRTAYFEDMPSVGTFQYRMKGWAYQPVDHYLRAFFLEERKKNIWYCVGSTPQYKLMMDITKQFMGLDGKRFIFTFSGDITHDDINMVQTADEDMAEFLRSLKLHLNDTLLVVMGDHGPRSITNKKRRWTLQGKFEERQPLMGLRLPAALVRARPAALAALQRNARALTTPHDLHATLLDVLGMTQHWNPYRVPGADLPRALSMLEPIPWNRSCSEAGIEPQWCACVTWQNLSSSDPMYNQTADALLTFINNLVCKVTWLCVPRALQSIVWVRRERPGSQLLAYSGNKDSDAFTSSFGTPTKITEQKYQLKVVLGPESDVFQALVTYVVKARQFLIKIEDVLWI